MVGEKRGFRCEITQLKESIFMMPIDSLAFVRHNNTTKIAPRYQGRNLINLNEVLELFNYETTGLNLS